MFEDTKRLVCSFSKKEEWIKINPVMYEFICKHKVVIEKMNEESVSVILLNRIEQSAKRNNLAYYQELLYNEFEKLSCFFVGNGLNQMICYGIFSY